MLTPIVSLLKQAAPTALVAVLLAVGAALWADADPSPAVTYDVESVIILAQIERAETMPATDVLIIGDSSALMGVDVAAVAERLGQRAEGLSTIGFVGPAGYASLLDRYLPRHDPKPTIVVLVNGRTTEIAGDLGALHHFEAFVKSPYADTDFFENARNKAHADLVAKAIDPPLKGPFGLRYGSPADLVRAIQVGRGSLVDPTPAMAPPEPGSVTPYVFTLSDGMAERFRVMQKAFERHGATRVLLGITPLPDAHADERTHTTRMEVRDRLVEILGASAVLDLPPTRPTTQFSSPAHLTEAGRAAFTEMFVEAYRQKR